MTFLLAFWALFILFSYSTLFAFAIRALYTPDPLLDRRTALGEFFTVFIQGGWLVLLSMQQKQIPVLTIGQGLALTSWMMLFSLFCAHLKVQRGILAIFIYGISLALFVFGLYSGIQLAPHEKAPAYGAIFAFHTLFILAGCSFCFLTGLFGFSYLMLKRELKRRKFGVLYHRLPALDVLNKMDFTATLLACLFFTLGTLFGCLLNYTHYQVYWVWNSKQILSLGVWFLLILNVLLRTVLKKWGRFPAQLSFFCGFVLFVGIIVMIFSYRVKAP